MCHTWYFRDHPEDHYQVDSERGDMGELNMIMEKVINIACRTFIKMPAHMEHEGKGCAKCMNNAFALLCL